MRTTGYDHGVPMQSGANRSHRGESVVKDVLEAAREELSRVGYRALRIEDVAARANVNRTTIYRRWPTKAELIGTTLRMMFDVPDIGPSTGSLRADLLVLARQAIAFLTSPNGQVFVRMVMGEGAEPELRAVLDSIRSEKDSSVKRLFESAKARGEMRRDVSSDLVVEHLIGGINHRIFALGMTPESIDVAEHVDLLLYGVLVRDS